MMYNSTNLILLSKIISLASNQGDNFGGKVIVVLPIIQIDI